MKMSLARWLVVFILKLNRLLIHFLFNCSASENTYITEAFVTILVWEISGEFHFLSNF